MYAMSEHSYADNGSVAVYDSQNHKPIFKLENIENKCLDISPNSKLIALPYEVVSVFDIASGKKLWNWFPNFEILTTICFSPNGKLLAVAGEYDTDCDFNDPNMKSIALYDLETGKNLWQRRCGLYQKILFSPDGSKLYTIGTADVNRNITSKVGMLDIEGNNFKEIFREKNRLRFWDFDVSPDGKTIICGGGYHHKEMENSTEIPISIFEKKSEIKKVVDSHSTYFTMEEKIRLNGHTDTVNSIQFSPDGKLAISSSSDRTIRIWNIKTGNQIHEFKFHASNVIFSPDGKYISFFSKGKFRSYDVETGKTLTK
jgi:WD40 repeat protein